MSTDHDSQSPPAAPEAPGRVGVYICHCGGNISDHVDVEQVEELARQTPGVAVARRNMFMCSDPGQEMIMEDIRSGRVDRVVVASCAPSLHETTFRRAVSRAGLNPYLYEHANIREQCSWVHHGDGATDKAAGLVSAAVAKSRWLTHLEPIRVQAVPHAVVVGGGIAGLGAARQLARRGLKVTLVERTPFLGGRASGLDRVYPTGEKAGDLIAALAGDVLGNPDIEVLTGTEVVSVAGYVGRFTLALRSAPPDGPDRERLGRARNAGIGRFVPFVGILPAEPPEAEATREIETGSVIMATGFTPYAPRKGEFGFGDHADVVTLPDLIRILAEAPASEKALFVDGRPVRSLAFVHCVGSRQIPGVHEFDDDRPLNEYCSRVCCTSSLWTAVEIRKRFPKTAVYSLFRDIRAYGRGHEDIYLEASRSGVRFIRYDPENPPRISRSVNGAPGRLSVDVADNLLAGEELTVPVDLVVLNVGMEPRDVSGLVDMFKLPKGADGFLLEVHPKLRPVEVSVSGVMLAGACQAPMDMSESSSAAAAAAAKSASLLVRGEVELDPFVARVDPDRCKGHATCVAACIRDGALRMVDTNNGRVAEVNPALCSGCGVCVAACPEGAIQVDGWTLAQYEAMVDAIVGRADTAEAAS